jgi:hypothetical protein
MGALSLEVNDAGLLALREGAPRPEAESPGVALLADDSVVVGPAAVTRARLRPRAVHDAFWDRLDTEPLARPFPADASRADLAYAHLSAVARALPAPPTEAFLAVPGFWSKGRLGLLMTLARAAGLPVAGLVDAAVAASSFAGGTTPLVHVDLTLHRAVVTALTGGTEIARTRVVDAEGLGQRGFEDPLADAIARRFVEETRFDPLHSGASEQALRDALPLWLVELRREGTCPAVLSAGGREHRVELTRAAAEAAIDAPSRDLAARIAAMEAAPGTRLLASARVSRIPGLADRLRSATGLEVIELPYDSAVSGTMRHRTHIRHAGDALPFVTRLPAWVTTVSSSSREGRRPTHLLNAGVAHALGAERLAIGTAPPLGVRGLGLRREGVLAHHCSLVEDAGERYVEDHSGGGTRLNGKRVEGRAVVRAGDRLSLGERGAELVLVAIEDDAR